MRNDRWAHINERTYLVGWVVSLSGQGPAATGGGLGLCVSSCGLGIGQSAGLG
jgi:hypothetical protein